MEEFMNRQEAVRRATELVEQMSVVVCFTPPAILTASCRMNS